MINLSLIELIVGVITTLGGGTLVGVVLKNWIAYRKLSTEERQALAQQKRDDFQLLNAVLIKQRDEAYATIDKINAKFEALEMEVQGLRLARDLDPFPHWVIDLEGRYLFVNREFEKQFLEPEGRSYRDMVGKRHEDLWPPEFCAKLRLLDSQARTRPDGQARAHTRVNGREITVHKFPVRVKAIPVAYAGYITEIDPIPEAGQ